MLSAYLARLFWSLAHGVVVLGIYLHDNDASTLLRNSGDFHWMAVVWPLALMINAFLYFKTSLMDPGFVPLSSQTSLNALDCEDNALFLETMEYDDNNTSENFLFQQPRRPYSSNCSQGEIWCDPCDILRIQRSKHCWQCNRCVRRYDHHCGWVGNCIGQRNHPAFILYVTFQCLSMALAALLLIQRSPLWSKHNALQLFDLVLIAMFSLMVIPLWAMHIYMMCTNQTTYESLRGRKVWYMEPIPEKFDHPFSRGCYANLKEFWCDADRMYKIPSVQHLEERDAKEDLCTNRYYECC